MSDRSSRPRTSPRRTPTRTERRIIKVRVLRRWGPARIAHLLRLVPSTVHRVLTRYGLARLTHLDRATGRVIRRYERDRPGELVGRQAGRESRSNAGYSYLHTAVDDHSRLAYSEILTDEKKETATGFWTRAQAFFTQAGITVERVLTDNGSCYRSRDWRDALAAAGIAHKRTRPYRPRPQPHRAIHLGRQENQLDVVVGGSCADFGVLVRGEVVQHTYSFSPGQQERRTLSRPRNSRHRLRRWIR
ncbi:hypothetical protein GCM10010346_63920 [Streptomyces chryseus]|uniref:Integrase catalytic domain-containing protein n=1 Tax=Streptomyces chryseus TaxID=68186 RepID=A0ABQ3EAR6_9ACTN|nr:hypothetical protein GCM10010346_63920 [Streptomyces chryseus]